MHSNDRPSATRIRCFCEPVLPPGKTETIELRQSKLCLYDPLPTFHFFISTYDSCISKTTLSLPNASFSVLSYIKP